MSKKVIEKKRILLEMAEKGEEKPIFGSVLYNAFQSYTLKSKPTYDNEFDLKLRELSPNWFKRKKNKKHKPNEKSAEKKRIILQMAREGKEKPKQKTMLGNALIRYITKSYSVYDAAFDLEVKKLAPQWFRYFEKCSEKREKLLEIARTGGKRPSWKTELGKCLIFSTCKSIKGGYNLKFDIEIRQLVPHWFKRKRRVSNEL